MATPHNFEPGSHVLITELLDDDILQAPTLSDAQSETTQLSHVIDSPIPEENEEDCDVSGGGGSVGDRRSSEDEEGEGEEGEDKDVEDEFHAASRLYHTALTNATRGGGGGVGGGSFEEGEEDEDEDGESYTDSMFMDGQLSDSFSDSLEPPPELKDEDFDTDLEVDDDKWLNPEKYDHDTTGLTKYMNACEEYDVTPVRYFVKHMLGLKMKLGHHGLGPAAIRALAVPMESNTTVELLDLEGNWIGEEGIRPLCTVLRENVYIVTLNLAENNLGTDGALLVLRVMLENRNVESLDLTGNHITDKAAEALAEMLRKNNTLHVLRLRHNALGQEAAQYLKDVLPDNETMEVLDLSWNHFMTRGCVLLAEGIKENVALKEVDLAMNGFGLEGALALGEAIKVNRTLLRLNASYCRLPLGGAASLAHGLQLNETLQQINVGYNSLGAEGTLALLLGLERNDCSGLARLDLGNSKVTVQFRELQTKLEEERELRVLHGGVLPHCGAHEVEMDPEEAFKRDPMTKLKEWVEQAGFRLIDLLRYFDKDNSNTISRDEFINGIKSTRIPITDGQINILLDRLDTDGDGEIDFRNMFSDSELIQGDNEHRSLKREVQQYKEEQRALQQETETDLDAFLKGPSITP